MRLNRLICMGILGLAPAIAAADDGGDAVVSPELTALRSPQSWLGWQP